MKISTSKFIKEGVALMSNCSVCKKRNCTNVRVIDVEAEWCMVHVTCSECGHAILAQLYTHEQGINYIGLMTDLSQEDSKTLLGDEYVNMDDVLGVHNLLSNGGFLGELGVKV